MFGKPQWFRPKTVGWGLTPVTWQGWGFTLAWVLVILLPFWALALRLQWPEALLWVGVAIGLLCLEVRQILQQIRRSETEPPHALDDGTVQRASHLTTARYKLRTRDD